ncbi:class I SAM-dependent methyltransferase [Palleronia sp. KMU-117]|uniref:class I SAM-dependent methyltransferase n=1 Tax=Palleronia sp. KMU-117 TaxID=3434108 RepID=UPI003D73B484
MSWYDPDSARAFATVAPLVAAGDPIVDVGGGASRLVDRLLDAGLGPVDVLDLSATALAIARARLGARAAAVGWIVADVTRWTPPRAYALWHDRAAFHFLTDPADRTAYVRTLLRALRPGGHAVLSTFAEDGPGHCSGLPVARYSPDALTATIEAIAPGAFERVAASRHLHLAPGGAGQRFQTTILRRGAG